MSKSLKQNLDQVLQESKFQTPDYYVGNTDQNVACIVALAQAVASAMVEEAFETLRSTWTQVLTSATTYSLPSDFLGFISGTMYQHGRWDRVDLPTTEETWALLNSISGISSLPIRARIIGDQFEIINPQVGATLNAEYYSNAPITFRDGTYITSFNADDNIWRLDDRLFQLELKWRFKKESGIPDWQIDLQETEKRRATVRARTNANSTIVPNLVTVSGQPFTNLWVN